MPSILAEIRKAWYGVIRGHAANPLSGMRKCAFRRPMVSTILATSVVNSSDCAEDDVMIATRSPGLSASFTKRRAAICACVRSPVLVSASSKKSTTKRGGRAAVLATPEDASDPAAGFSGAAFSTATAFPPDRSVSTMKDVMARSLPSSSTWKSLCFSPAAARPCASRTTTPTSTNPVSTRSA